MAPTSRVSLLRKPLFLAVVALVPCVAVYCAREPRAPELSADRGDSSFHTPADERGLAGGVGDHAAIMERAQVGRWVVRLTSMLDGSPVGGVDMFLFEEGQLTYRTSSNEQGDVLVPVPSPMAAWQLRAQGVPVAEGSASLLEGREVLPIPVYPQVTIRLLVDGEMPDAAIPFRLLGVAHLVASGMAEVSSIVAGFEVDQIALALSSEPGGFLRIPCMPMDWTGSLAIADDGLRFAGAGAVLDVRGSELPGSCLLTSIPAILGRVVDGEAMQPAPGVEVGFRTVCAQGEQIGFVATGLDGRFRIPFQCGPLRRADISAIIPNRAYGGLTVEGEYSESFDIGDIHMVPGRALAFEVVDGDHEPVQGAVVLCSGFRSQPTDEDGATVLAGVPWEATSVSTYAVGYREAVDPLSSASEDGRMVVTLERDTTLFLDLSSPAGPSPLPVRVVVSTGGPLFGGSNSARPHPVIEELSPGVLARSACETTQSAILKSTLEVIPDSSEEIVLTGLVPFVPIRVEMRDLTGEVAGELYPVVLDAGEWRTATFTPATVFRSFHARCVGPAGEAIVGARVEFGSDSHPQRTASDQDGRVRIDGILVDAIDLRIVADGYATVVHEGIPVSAGTASCAYVIPLTTGNRVSVHASDPQGGRVPLDTVEAWMGDALLARQRSSPEGVVILEGLPLGRVEFRTTLLGRHFRREHDSATPTAVFDAPSTGTLWVKLPAEPVLGKTLSLEVYQADEPSCRILKELLASDLEAGVVVVEPIFIGSYGVRLYQSTGGQARAAFETARAVEVVARARTEVALVPR